MCSSDLTITGNFVVEAELVLPYLFLTVNTVLGLGISHLFDLVSLFCCSFLPLIRLINQPALLKITNTYILDNKPSHQLPLILINFGKDTKSMFDKVKT